MTMNVSNYEFKNGLYLPRENSRQGLRYEINFSEEQRREAIKQRTRDAVAKKPKPKLNKNAQEYLKKIQQELATTGEATQLVSTAKHPLAGAAYASRQTALERLWGPQVLDLGNGATSTTYFGTAEELRNVAPLGNIAPDLTPAPAPTPAPTAVEVKPPQTVIGNAEIPTIQNESVVKPEAPTAQIPQESKPISPVASEAEAVTPKPKLKPEGGKSSKGFWGKIFKSKGGRIGAVALTAAVAYGAYKLFGGDDNKNAEVKQNNPVQEQKATAPADTTATQKETPVAEEAKPEVKSETNTEAKPVVTPAPVAENDSIAKADAATEVEKADDAKAVVAKPETEETEEAEKTEKTEEAKEAEEAKKAEEELNEWIAQKGENYWKYAKQELIFEHQGQAGYKPTNNEINERMLKIMERNGVNFANDGIHSNPMLKIGDKVKVKFGTEEKAA